MILPFPAQTAAQDYYRKENLRQIRVRFNNFRSPMQPFVATAASQLVCSPGSVRSGLPTLGCGFDAMLRVH
jgi:hypothetical protein